MAKGGGDQKRVKRFAERVRQEIAELVLHGRLHEPDADGVLISRVMVTPDLRVARVFVRHEDPEITEFRKKKLLVALGRAKGFLRRELADRLDMKHAPEMEFRWDVGLDHAMGIEALLDEIERDAKKQKGNP